MCMFQVFISTVHFFFKFSTLKGSLETVDYTNPQLRFYFHLVYEPDECLYVAQKPVAEEKNWFPQNACWFGLELSLWGIALVVQQENSKSFQTIQCMSLHLSQISAIFKASTDTNGQERI